MKRLLVGLVALLALAGCGSTVSTNSGQVEAPKASSQVTITQTLQVGVTGTATCYTAWLKGAVVGFSCVTAGG